MAPTTEEEDEDSTELVSVEDTVVVPVYGVAYRDKTPSIDEEAEQDANYAVTVKLVQLGIKQREDAEERAAILNQGSRPVEHFVVRHKPRDQ